MNSVKPQQELDLLVNVIRRHPEGVSAEEVLHESGLALQRRSLQRRLAVLLEQGRIRVQGQARAVRYFPVLEDESPNGEHASSADAEIEPYVPVSAEGEAIKVYVRHPRPRHYLSRRRCTSSAGGEANRGNLSIKDCDGAQHSVDAIDSQLRKIEGQSLGYNVARFFDLLGR
mgnify:CR=1 FL=1